MLVLSGFERTRVVPLSGDDGEEVTPVPIPNTEVKLFSADGSRGLPPVRVRRRWAVISKMIVMSKLVVIIVLFRSSSVVEQSAVNRSVVGSSPTCGANWRAVRVAEGARLEIVY